jgi:hypothetical protein
MSIDTNERAPQSLPDRLRKFRTRAMNVIPKEAAPVL